MDFYSLTLVLYVRLASDWLLLVFKCTWNISTCRHRWSAVIIGEADVVLIALCGRHMKPTLRNISVDTRCDVHQTVLGIREGKEGWFDLYCPGGVACDDDGELYSVMVSIVCWCCLYCTEPSFHWSRLSVLQIEASMTLSSRQSTSAQLTHILFPTE